MSWDVTTTPVCGKVGVVHLVARSGRRVIHRDLRAADAATFDPEADWQAGLLANTKAAGLLRERQP